MQMYEIGVVHKGRFQVSGFRYQAFPDTLKLETKKPISANAARCDDRLVEKCGWDDIPGRNKGQ
jgi:hypothetical protein